ncbi:pyrroline-5-carboxylate reductase [Thermodesulfobacteriota bacterium]
MDTKNLKLGIIGGGIMAENILRGLLSSETLAPGQVMVSDLSPDRLSYLKDSYKVKTILDNSEILSKNEVIILAVKPQNMKGLLEQVRPSSGPEKLFLSIAAGLKAEAIARGLGGRGRIIRIMPNTAARVLESASALCRGPGATLDDLNLAKHLFESIGQAVVVNEELMDAVTGLSGSGPAYIFLIVEALADAGVKAGLPRPVALNLAAQTCFGAAKLVLETGEHPGVLKDQVTSPGGTTISGLHALEQQGLRGALMDAVQAAVARSRELGKY